MAEEIIVALDGSGDFTDIQSALNAADPGDTVYIRSGDYSVPNGVDLNTPNVTVAGYPGDEPPHLYAANGSDGPHAVFSFGIDSDGSTLRGVEISGGREYVLKLETAWEYGDQAFGNAAQNITIENNILHDSGRDVIKLTPNSDGVKILNNDIYNSGRGGTDDDHPAYNAEGIDAVNVDDLTVSGNHIYDIATTGAYAKGGSRNVVFENNLIENTGLSTAETPNSAGGLALGYTTDGEFFDPDNTGYVQSYGGVIQNNVIINTPDSAILLGGAQDTLVDSNTIINAGMETASLRWFLGGVAVYPMRTWTGGSDYIDAQTTGSIITNNIIHTAASAAGDEAWALNDPLVVAYSGMATQSQIDGNVYWDGNGVTSFGGRSFEDHQAATGFDQNSAVFDFLGMLDSSGRVIEGSALDTTGAGAAVLGGYGYSADYTPDVVEDTEGPATPVITGTADYDTQYYDGTLIYIEGSSDTSYYNIYLDGELVQQTTGDGYFLQREGTFSLTVEAVDQHGNVSAPTEAYEVTYGDPDANLPGSEPTDPGSDPGTEPEPTPEPVPEPIEQTVATEGDDVFYGRQTAEHIDGLGGTDTIDYSNSTYGVTIDLYSGYGYSAFAEGDTFANMENVIGTNFSDHIRGTSTDNHLVGQAGGDTIIAGAGNDTIEGGTGSDTYIWYRGSGNDVIDQQSAGAGDLDVLEFGSYIGSDDLTFAMEGDTDLVISIGGSNGGGILVKGFVNADGGAGLHEIHLVDGTVLDHATITDLADGAAPMPDPEPIPEPEPVPEPEPEPAPGNVPTDGDDVLLGEAGAQIIDGLGGVDTIDYSGSTYGITLDLYYGAGYGAYAEGDRLSNVENAIGTNYSDHLSGNILGNVIDGGAGNDYINGRYGNDTLLGGEGDDILRGGLHDDDLWGGDGVDTFRFDYGHGDDVIHDFDTEEDIIDLSGLSLVSLDAVSFSSGVVDGIAGTLIETSESSSIFIANQMLGQGDIDILI